MKTRKIVIGVIVGFIVWTALRFGAVGVVYAAFPDGFDEAGAPTNLTASLLVLFSTLPVSVVAGWVCARLGRPHARAAGGVLVGVQVVIGGLVQLGYLDLLPWWWHALFFVQLVVGLLVGGALCREPSQE